MEKYISVKGVNIRYWEMGDKGADLILIHGIGHSIEAWENNVEFLSHNHRVFAVDLPGFGRSDKPDHPYSFQYFAQFIIDFMDVLDIEQASLVGNSMGGGISQYVTFQAPNRVAKSVLVNSAGFSRNLTILFRISSIPVLGELLNRPSKKGTRRVLKECVYDPSLITEEMVALGYEIVSQPGATRAFLTTLRSGVKFAGLRKEVLQTFSDNYPSIQSPTLVIWGRQDRILPVSGAKVAEQGIPNATVKIFDPCGHVPQIERPDEFNAIVEEFLLK